MTQVVVNEDLVLRIGRQRTALSPIDKSGGEQYFLEQVSKKPVAFMTLIGKVLPRQLSGEFGGPVLIGGNFAERLVRARERVPPDQQKGGE